MSLEPVVNGKSKEPGLNWAPIMGRWDITSESQTFRGEGQSGSAYGQPFPMGLAVSSGVMQNGMCHVKVRFAAAFGDQEQAGGVVIGYRSPEQHYIFAELGAARSAYSVGEYISGFGWKGLVAAGQRENLSNDRDYTLQGPLLGQELRMLVDDVPVLQHLLSQPLDGRQVGLIAAGNAEVRFSSLRLHSARPRAFVAMQFAEPYDTFFGT